MTFIFNKQQQQLISEYKQLISYGNKKISKVGLNVQKTRIRKKVLYFLMGAMQSYSESVLKLMGSEPVYEKPGESFLRSQFEIWLNIRFIYSSRSEEKARLFSSEAITESIDFAKKHKKLWIKYPAWNLEFGYIKNSSDWNNFIRDNLGDLKKYQDKYGDKNVTKVPNLFDRTLAIDGYLKKIGTFSEKKSAEKYYTLYYKYFSQATHLSMPALLRFINESKLSFYIDSKPEDAERILAVSYQVYFTTLYFFLNIFGAYKVSEFKSFKDYSKSILKSRNASS